MFVRKQIKCVFASSELVFAFPSPRLVQWNSICQTLSASHDSIHHFHHSIPTDSFSSSSPSLNAPTGFSLNPGSGFRRFNGLFVNTLRIIIPLFVLSSRFIGLLGFFPYLLLNYLFLWNKHEIACRTRLFSFCVFGRFNLCEEMIGSFWFVNFAVRTLHFELLQTLQDCNSPTVEFLLNILASFILGSVLHPQILAKKG